MVCSLKQGLNSEDGSIPVSAVLDMIQHTLVFPENANQLFSEKRCLGLITQVKSHQICIKVNSLKPKRPIW